MRTTPKKTGFLSVRIDPELLQQIREIAVENERTLAAQIVYAVRVYCNNYRVQNSVILRPKVVKKPQSTTNVEGQA